MLPLLAEKPDFERRLGITSQCVNPIVGTKDREPDAGAIFPYGGDESRRIYNSPLGGDVALAERVAGSDGRRR